MTTLESIRRIYDQYLLASSLRASSYAKPILCAVNIMDIEQLHKDIYTAQQSDQHCKDIIINITNPESPESPESPDPEPRWSLDDQQLLCYDNRIWIPDTDDLQLRILLNKHDHLLSGHYGQNKTMELVRRDYTWPRVQTFVKDYCKSCTTCARSKTPRHKPYGNLWQLPIPKKPWNSISIDFIEHIWIYEYLGSRRQTNQASDLHSDP